MSLLYMWCSHYNIALIFSDTMNRFRTLTCVNVENALECLHSTQAHGRCQPQGKTTKLNFLIAYKFDPATTRSIFDLSRISAFLAPLAKSQSTTEVYGNSWFSPVPTSKQNYWFGAIFGSRSTEQTSLTPPSICVVYFGTKVESLVDA